jgi:hypothetical protein
MKECKKEGIRAYYLIQSPKVNPSTPRLEGLDLLRIDPKRHFFPLPIKGELAFDPSPSMELRALGLLKGSGRRCAAEWVNLELKF